MIETAHRNYYRLHERKSSILHNLCCLYSWKHQSRSCGPKSPSGLYTASSDHNCAVEVAPHLEKWTHRPFPVRMQDIHISPIRSPVTIRPRHHQRHLRTRSYRLHQAFTLPWLLQCRVLAGRQLGLPVRITHIVRTGRLPGHQAALLGAPFMNR